jgi:ADP-ribose pyrophosphatase YjhB (NUDIX family)
MPIFRFCPFCAHALPTPAELPERVVRQECPHCRAEHFRNAKPTASALVVRDGRVLLGRRSIEPHKDLWDVPGGFLEPWEDPLDGVRREVLEETGYEIEPGEVLAILVDVYDDPSVYTFNVYYLARILGGEPRPADDVAELCWFGPDELPEVAFATGRKALRLWRQRVVGSGNMAC